MTKCVACKKRIFPWQKIGVNSSWHKQCWETWNSGYQVALNYCENMNKLEGYSLPHEIYFKRLPGVWVEKKTS